MIPASRCPECGSVDACEHDAAFERIYVALLILAVLGLLFALLLVLAGGLALVRWLS